MLFFFFFSHKNRPPRPIRFVDQYGEPTSLIPIQPTGYQVCLGAPVAWKQHSGGQFATAPIEVEQTTRYEENGTIERGEWVNGERALVGPNID